MTVIWFSVSVPVLSVQITVVSPSVSTAESRRTIALRRAIRCVASASESVTVGSRPSGTLATMTPIANRKRSVAPIPSVPASRKNAAPSETESSATTRVIRRISSSSGLSWRSAPAVSVVMRPSSVCMPVAATSASAAPRAT